jgi:hypothetical protein
MEDIVPKNPDLKDMISMDEAAPLEGASFDEIEDLKEHGELSPPGVGERRLLDRKEAARLKKETDMLQEDIGDNS